MFSVRDYWGVADQHVLTTTCTKLHGGTSFLHLGHLPFYGLALLPYSLFLYDPIYTPLVLQRTNSLSTGFSLHKIRRGSRRVGNPATGDPHFLATTCTYPHGGISTA